MKMFKFLKDNFCAVEKSEDYNPPKKTKNRISYWNWVTNKWDWWVLIIVFNIRAFTRLGGSFAVSLGEIIGTIGIISFFYWLYFTNKIKKQ